MVTKMVGFDTICDFNRVDEINCSCNKPVFYFTRNVWYWHVARCSFCSKVSGVRMFRLTLSGAYEETALSCTCGCVRRLTIGSHIAAAMRASLHSDLGITCCAGVGYNKLLAKLVGSVNKPNQQTVIFQENVDSFMLSLKGVRSIPGTFEGQVL